MTSSSNKYGFEINKENREYIDCLRGISIWRVVLGHLGLFWIFKPYSEFVGALLPLLFFASGAVSFGSFSRSTTIKKYIYRRMTTLLVPYYVVAGFALLIYFVFNKQFPGSGTFIDTIRWLLLNPVKEQTPFPLGQVWFLHSLAIITLVSVPVFIIARKYIMILLCPIMISIIFAVIQLFFPIASHMMILGHNFYQPMSNACFYLIGALYVSTVDEMSWGNICRYSIIANIVMILAVVNIRNLKIGLSYHSYSPDIYYVGCAMIAISIILYFKTQILKIINKLKTVKKLLIFASTHAYSIFMVHSFFIFATERWLNLVNVAKSPLLAIVKILLVLISCAIVSPMITKITKYASNIFTKYTTIAYETYQKYV